MPCKNPYMVGALATPCGRCLPCRVARRREWMWRQIFESYCHKENCFVTLTYDDKNMPRELVKSDLQKFFKRLRARFNGVGIRFFAVGEYGDKTWRPHYHASLFGLSGRTDVISATAYKHWGDARIINEAWGKGYILCAEFNDLTASYVAGYTVKKMTQKPDKRLQGRAPEFARMSLRPALGTAAMTTVASSLLNTGLSWRDGDVPPMLKIGKRHIPLGRTLLQKLRTAAGFSPEYIAELKATISYDRTKELLALFQDQGSTSFKEAHKEANAQKNLQIEARHNIWSKKGPL